MHIGRKVLVGALMLFMFTFIFYLVAFAETISYGDIGTVTVQTLNLRKSPDISSKILSKIKYGEKVNIISNSKDWYKVNYGGVEGWVYSSYIKISQPEIKTGQVNADLLRVRKNPGTTAAVISKLQKGKTFEVLDSSKNWFRIKTPEGLTGWVCADYVVLIKTTDQSKDSIAISHSSENEPEHTGKQAIEDNITEETLTDKENDFKSSKDEKSDNNSENEKYISDTKDEVSLGQQVIDYAKKFIGVKYVFGGNTPEQGFDCSGFTKYVFSNFSINLERTAASQAGQGIQANMDELAIGDLVFFDTSGNGKNIDHVGIYMGDNKFIHASSPRSDVTIASLSDSYFLKSYVTARRVLKD